MRCVNCLDVYGSDNVLDRLLVMWVLRGCCFFFQAEDGIRDVAVTGVQTCALPISYTNAKLLATTDSLTSWLEGGGTGGVGQVQDWNNLKAEKSLASQDVSQRLVISYVLDLPLGRGQIKHVADYKALRHVLRRSEEHTSELRHG